jgi:hypothetical protein
MKDPIAWRLLPGKNDRIISQTILEQVPRNQPGFKPRYGSCAGVVALDGQRRLFINFIARTEDPNERSTFMSMGEAILGSILPIEAVIPGKVPPPVPAGPPAASPAPPVPAPPADPAR